MSETEIRIAVLGTRGFPGVQGGVERHCENLYALLVERGCRVRVYTRRPYGDPRRGYTEGVERYPLWAPKSKGLEAVVHTFLGIMHVITRRREFDILHIHAIGPSVMVPLGRLFGLTIIVTNHGADYERQKWGPLARLVLKLGERWGSTYANGVIAVARHIQERLERQYHRTVYYIPNGIPKLAKRPPGELLRRHGLHQGRYILAVGRFVPEKGFHDLLTAFKSSTSAWRVVLTGAADHEDEYSKALVREAQQDDRIVLTGTLTGKDLEEVYTNAGIFVLPSYHEGLPLTLLEALSYGLPVLASDIPANREIITDQSRTFRPGDVERLRTLLASEMRDVTDGKRPGDGNAADYAEFFWDKIAAKTMDVYRKTLS